LLRGDFKGFLSRTAWGRPSRAVGHDARRRGLFLRAVVFEPVVLGIHLVGVLWEAAGPDAPGDEAVGAFVEIRPDDVSGQQFPDRVARDRHREQEAKSVGDDAGREQERAGGDEQRAVHQFGRRQFARPDLSLEAPDRLSALGAHEQHPHQSGEHDQQHGPGPPQQVRDDEQKQHVRQRDEQEQRDVPARTHTASFPPGVHSPCDAGSSGLDDGPRRWQRPRRPMPSTRSP